MHSMGKLVTIEGIEGSGKSSLQKTLAAALTAQGIQTIITREPGGTPLGKKIREILLSAEYPEIAPTTELMLFSADRAQHVAEVIRPALNAGKVVVCDRFTHSTLAYQGYGRGLPLEKLRELIILSTNNLRPDLVLLLDLPPEIGLKRAKSRATQSTSAESSWTRFEQQELEFHKKVRDGFLELARTEPETVVVIDANRPQQIIAEEAIAVLKQLLKHSS